MTDEPTIVIHIEGAGHNRQPGETLCGEYWIESLDASLVKSIEVSVLWHTEGKGDEDMAVHEFLRRNAEDGRPFDLRQPEPFSTTLPNSPLSYEGQIIKVRWCVRVRVIPHRGREMVAEKSFHLGCVPPVAASSLSVV